MDFSNLEIVERRTLFKLYSLYYWSKGFNLTHVNGLIPIKNPVQDYKSPTHSIDELKTQRQEFNHLSLFDWNNASGIGAVSGVNTIRCIDIDGCNELAFLKFILSELKLKEDYEWVVKTGSNNGFHIWIKVDELSDRWEVQDNYVFWPNEFYDYYFKRIELRWNTHTLLPPSIHNSGNTYKFLNVNLPNLQPAKVDSSLVYNILSTLSKDISFEIKHQHHVAYSEDFYIPQFCSINEAEEKILFIDLETTGLPALKNAEYDDVESWPFILQAAWIQSSCDRDHIYFTKNFLLKPGNIEVEPSSVIIHGITKESAEKNGVSREKVLRNIVEFIKTSDFIVCHNADFDVNLLKCELFRIGVDVESLFYKKQIICTMKSTVDFCQIPSKYGNYKWPSLQELFWALFNDKFEGEHDALMDVHCTYVCFNSLKAKGIININKTSLDSINAENNDLPF